MNIEHIHIDAFGTLENFDSGTGSLGSLVVVLGPNEAGKSTLFSFLQTALYGFYPANKDQHPYFPWGSDEAAGTIQFRLADGSCCDVERKLRSEPTGSVTHHGEASALGNHDLPWVSHIPRDLFPNVFEITLKDLAGYSAGTKEQSQKDRDTWRQIHGEALALAGGLGTPVDKVAQTLEDEASAIWRPNERGNQRLMDLKKKKNELQERRRRATERDRDIRDLIAEKEDAGPRLDELKQEHQQLINAITPVQKLARLKKEMDSNKKERQAKEQEISNFDRPAQGLCELRDEINTFIVLNDQSLVARNQQLQLEDEIRSLESNAGKSRLKTAIIASSSFVGILLLAWSVSAADLTLALLSSVLLIGAFTALILGRNLRRRISLLKDSGATTRAQIELVDQKAKQVSAKLDQDFEDVEAFARTIKRDLEKASELQHLATAAQSTIDKLDQDLGVIRDNIDHIERELDPIILGRAHDDDDWPQGRTEELVEEIDQLTRLQEGLRAREAELMREETVDAVQGELDSLEEGIEELTRQRDQKWVIAKLIREADRQFREEHESYLLKQAGIYLARLTNGRYTGLEIHEGSDRKQPLFDLVGPALTKCEPLAHPISTATLEQAYLSLRLAVIDHFDKKGEALPLFIDEAFVNWDPTREQHGLEVLSDLSNSRQVFVFTCHPPVAELLKQHGGQVLELGSKM